MATSKDESSRKPPVSQDDTCPTAETLKEVLTGTVEVTATLDQHLLDCARCRDLLDRLSEPESLDEYRVHARRGADPADGLDPPLHPDDLGSFDGLAIQGLVGRGGMGIVYRGYEPALNRTVAVKILTRGASSESDRRFEREARAAALLRHPNVVPVYRAGRGGDGRPYLVMPLIEGETLKARIERGLLSPTDSADIARQIALALSAAHAAGMIHRDVKPGNILLDRDDGHAKLTDFGLVRSEIDATLTKANVVCGTPAYMSPEQIVSPHDKDSRGDLYSLGVVLYECLTGSTPFRGLPLEVLEQHRTSDPLPLRKLNRNVPVELQNICLKALNKQPQDRYGDAAAMAADLGRFLAGEPVVARETPSWRKAWLWSKRNPAVARWISVSLILLLVLAGGAIATAWHLSKVNKTIGEARDKAEQSELVAVEDRTAAVEALERLVDSLYDDLSSNAATIATREKVVNAAIAGLEAMAKIEDDRRANRTIFRAHLRISDLASLRGSFDEAEQHLQAAIDIAEAMDQQNPDTKQGMRDLAMALSRKAQLDYLRLLPSTAISLERGFAIVDRQLNANPADAEAMIRRLLLRSIELEWLRSQNPTNPQLLLDRREQVEKEMVAIPESDRNVVDYWEVAEKLRFVMGRAYLESNDAVQADEQFAEAEPLVEKMLETSPANVRFRSAAAILMRARGMSVGNLGQLDRSIQYLQNAVDNLQQLAALDPEDQQQQVNLANTRVILAMALGFAGNTNASIQCLEQSLSTFDRILDAQPDNEHLRRQALEARSRLGELLHESGQWQAAYDQLSLAHESIRLLCDLHPEATFTQQLLKENQATLEGLSQVLGRSESVGVRKGQAEALVLLLKFWSRSATDLQLTTEQLEIVQRIAPELEVRQYKDLITQLPELEPERYQPMSLGILQSKMFGSIAGNAAQLGTDVGDATSTEATRLVWEGVDTIAAYDAQAAIRGITIDQRFKWLRSQEGFQQKLKEHQHLWNAR